MHCSSPRSFVAPAALALALGTGVSMATEPDPAADDPRMAIEAEFGALDTNANLLIDKTEAKASKELEQNFAQLDANNDGQLSEAEFAGFERYRSTPAVSKTETRAVEKTAEPAEPKESWFTAPQHKPRGDEEPERGREGR